MPATVFIVSLVAQLLSGFALTPLCVFWYTVFPKNPNIVRQALDTLFWATVSGASLGIMTGTIVSWVVILFAAGTTVFLLRNFVILTLNHVTLSLLLLVFIGVITALHSELSLYGAGGYYITYALLFFIAFAFHAQQKNHKRRFL